VAAWAAQSLTFAEFRTGSLSNPDQATFAALVATGTCALTAAQTPNR
jgi:hypothetical protein